MTDRLPSHRSEQTGNPTLDRIQSNVRDLIAFARGFVARVVTLERTHGRAGIVRAELHNADRALTSDEFHCGQIVFVGTLSADRTVQVPRASDATAYFRWFYNGTSGGKNVNLATQDGSLVLAPATQYGVWVSSSGPGAASAA